MAIRPTDLPPPLMPLAGVADAGKSMDRDARERSSFGGRGHSDDGSIENEEQDIKSEHIIDESA